MTIKEMLQLEPGTKVRHTSVFGNVHAGQVVEENGYRFIRYTDGSSTYNFAALAIIRELELDFPSGIEVIADPAPAKTPGQLAYEADLQRQPNYDDGKPRPTWEMLGDGYASGVRDAMRRSWEKTPDALSIR